MKNLMIGTMLGLALALPAAVIAHSPAADCLYVREVAGERQISAQWQCLPEGDTQITLPLTRGGHITYAPSDFGTTVLMIDSAP